MMRRCRCAVPAGALKTAAKPYRAALKVDQSGQEAWFLSRFFNEKQKPPKGAVRIRCKRRWAWLATLAGSSATFRPRAESA